jgi:hypothetical protein
MGSVGHVDSFDREAAQTKVDPGGGENVTAQHYAAPGVDAAPLPGDYAGLQPCAGTGRQQALGYCDPLPENRKASDGEHRIYGRDADGRAVCEIWCKLDGSIVIDVIGGTAPIEIRTKGPIIANSPDVRLGGGGRKVATVGDLVSGSVYGLCTAPGTPHAPNPAPVAGSGVPFVGRIISGVTGVTASTGDGEE